MAGSVQTPVDGLPFWLVARYIQKMSEAIGKRERQRALTLRLLDSIQRPASLWPLVRVLFPHVRRASTHIAGSWLGAMRIQHLRRTL